MPAIPYPPLCGPISLFSCFYCHPRKIRSSTPYPSPRTPKKEPLIGKIATQNFKWRSTGDQLPEKPLDSSGHVVAVVRHGHGTHIRDSFFNASLSGPKQAKLTDLGKQQAKEAAQKIQRLVKGTFFALVSPLLRTRETFHIMEEEGLRIHDIRIEKAVIEAGTGEHEGQPYDWVIGKDYNSRDPNRQPILWKGESKTAVEKRVLSFVKSDLLPLLEKQNALIVTHQAVMEALEPDAEDAVPGEIRVYTKGYLLSWIKKMEDFHAQLEA